MGFMMAQHQAEKQSAQSRIQSRSEQNPFQLLPYRGSITYYTDNTVVYKREFRPVGNRLMMTNN